RLTTQLDEVGQRDVASTTAVLRHRDGFLIVEVIRVGGVEGVNIVPGEAATTEVTTMHAYAQTRPGDVMHREVGIVEGGVVRAPTIQPGVTASEDVVNHGWCTTIRPSVATIAREAVARQPWRSLRGARGAKRSATKALGVVEAGNDELAIVGRGDGGFA